MIRQSRCPSPSWRVQSSAIHRTSLSILTEAPCHTAGCCAVNESGLSGALNKDNHSVPVIVADRRSEGEKERSDTPRQALD